MKQKLNPLQVRMPDAFKTRLKELALENNRSMNSEIVFRLRNAIFDPLEMQKGSEVSA